MGAIIWSGYLGQLGASALADTIFGRSNPSGRLTTTFYPASFIDVWKPGIDPYIHGATTPARNASYFDVHMRPNATSGNPGRTCKFAQKFEAA
eukprot:1863950-Prymnesium_polylepis.1